MRTASLLTLALTLGVAPAAAQANPPATDRGYGAWFGSIPDLADAEMGIRLEGTTPGSPAAKAGLRKGDLLTMMAGDTVRTLGDMVAVLRRHEPGKEIAVVYRRGPITDTVKVILGVRPGS